MHYPDAERSTLVTFAPLAMHFIPRNEGMQIPFVARFPTGTGPAQTTRDGLQHRERQELNRIERPASSTNHQAVRVVGKGSQSSGSSGPLTASSSVPGENSEPAQLFCGNATFRNNRGCRVWRCRVPGRSTSEDFLQREYL